MLKVALNKASHMTATLLAGYPLMPPRLVNSCDDPYGGCMKQYTFEDTLDTVGGLWSWKNTAVSKVSNHYAAMPSMHAGYSLWCSISMYKHSPLLVFRALAILYPLLTLYCIVVTANHYFMDAICGGLALLIATALAPYMPKAGRGADEETVADGTLEERTLLLPITKPTEPATSSSNSSKEISMGAMQKW